MKLKQGPDKRGACLNCGKAARFHHATKQTCPVTEASVGRYRRRDMRAQQ